MGCVMKKHPASKEKFMNFAVIGVILLTLVLGFAPRVLKASSSKPDLVGGLGCAQTAPSCTPSATPAPTQE